MAATARRSVAVALTATLLAALPAATATAGPAPAGTSATTSTATVRGFDTAPLTVDRRLTAVTRLTDIRHGKHAGYDRLVLQFAGKVPGFDIRYVNALHQDGSGNRVSLLGARDLRIRLDMTAAHDDNGRSTLRTASRATPKFPALREWRLIGDFEGVVTVGTGVSDRQPFRVMQLANPSRLVIDVKHPLPAPTSTATKSAPALATGMPKLTDIRIGDHPGYTRVVFQFSGRAPGYRVGYVPAVYQDGSGAKVQLAGTHFLGVRFEPAAAHRDDGTLTYTGPREIKRSGTLRELELAGDFEGVVSAGIGVAAKKGFRVLRLSNPTRIVVDVAK